MWENVRLAINTLAVIFFYS